MAKRKSDGQGCGTILLLLIMVGLGAFCYGMYRWQEGPQQTWQRVSVFARHLFEAKPAATPVPTPSPTAKPVPAIAATTTPTATPTPRPDPLAWLLEHKERWPQEVKLLAAEEFPAVSSGKRVGSLKLPAGAAVKVIDITPSEVTVDFRGGTRRLAIVATDLGRRAEAALTEAEAKSQQVAQTAEQASSAEMKIEPEFAREASRQKFNAGLGAIFTRQATTFRLFAPTAKAVRVILYDAAVGDAGRQESALRQQPNGLWELKVSGNLRGKFYTYLLEGPELDSAREVLDPYATNAVASSTRGRITEMPPPPRPGPSLAAPPDAVIYEMHVRDFTIDPNSEVEQAGLYLGWTETKTHLPDEEKIKTALDHLSELGVTHVELLPMQDFENDESAGDYNWGYITTAFFSPEGMFASNPNDDSRVREFKALVDALHARGIGVIMDVVYNHTSPKAPFFAIAPEYYYRHLPDGSLANGSGCGNEFRSEAPMARKLIIDSLKFWVKEYGIDGFRFDLMALLDQQTMRQAEHELHAIKPGILLYGEPWKAGDSPLRDGIDKGSMRKVQSIGAFNDDFRNALKGYPDGDGPGWIQDGSKRAELKAAMLGTSWLPTPAQSINYMTCHDNLVLWDKLEVSMPNASEELREETMKLGYLALFTAQGVPFIQGGEEFARSKGGNNNSYDAPDSVNQVGWELKQKHLELFHYVRDLIALRKAHPMFRLRTREQVAARVKFVETPNEKVLMFIVGGVGVPGETWSRACVILNSDSEPAEVMPPGSSWKLALDRHGAKSDAVIGKVSVPAKSGMVLYQR
ncbi:MAG: type I pullulanase [Verrucomicrobiota bacterium]|nr:type I pullulanase [Verrucomicrobiota bacterium]